MHLCVCVCVCVCVCGCMCACVRVTLCGKVGDLESTTCYSNAY